MICGEGTAVIRRPARDVLEYVLDLPRYAEADHKIRWIREVHRDGNRGHVRHGGMVRGLPGPPVTLTFELEPYSSLRFRNAPSGLGRWVFQFDGSFMCEEAGGGTRVVHRECFQFPPPLRWLVEPYLRDWLRRDTSEEMQRMKAILEGAA